MANTPGELKLQNHKGPGAVIFDMDGVLVNSNPFHVEKWVEFLREQGIPFNEADLPRQILGHGNHDCFLAFFGPDLPKKEMIEMEEMLEERFRKTFGPHAELLPGLMTLIEELRKAGMPLGVASSAVRENVEFILETLKLDSVFSGVTTGSDFPRPKPDPGIYLLAAQKLGVPPSDCVAFEDSFVGIEAAKRAGMKCIGLASTFPARDLRSKTDADNVIESFHDVTLADLKRLFNSHLFDYHSS